jgi:hypothetical protein
MPLRSALSPVAVPDPLHVSLGRREVLTRDTALWRLNVDGAPQSIDQKYTLTTVVYSLAEVAIDVLGRAKRNSGGRAVIVHAYHDA